MKETLKKFVKAVCKQFFIDRKNGKIDIDKHAEVIDDGKPKYRHESIF